MSLRVFLPAALGLLACGATPPSDVTPTSPSAAPSTSGPVTITVTLVSSAATGTAGPPDMAGPAGTATAAPALATAEPALVPTASSLTGPPAAKGSKSGVPGAAPTPDELKTIAMCLGKAAIFTEKEAKLLRMADASTDGSLHETADAIRERRKEMLKAACDRLRADGKL